MNKNKRFKEGEDNMKKAIAILLVVLVAGVMFGAVAKPGDAELKLVANQGGFFDHKVTAAVWEGPPGQWSSATELDPSGNGMVVDLADTDPQSYGYYSVQTNSKMVISSIDVTATALATGSDYYIPYTLNVGAISSSFDLTKGGTVLPVWTNLSLDITSLGGNGMRYLSQAIKITLDEDYSLSAYEGDYEATIKFAITAN